MLRKFVCLVHMLRAMGVPLAFADKPKEPLDKITVQLSWKYQFQFAAFITALEKGYYQQSGLDVNLLEGGPQIDPVTEVVKGHADFGVMGSALVLYRYQGQPVAVLAVMMQHSAVGVLADKHKGISSVHDLAGRLIRTSADTTDEIRAYLLAEGIPENKINIQQKTLLGLAELEANRADAISLYVSNELFLAKDKSDRYLLLSPRSSGIDLYGNALFTSERQIKQYPERVKAFRAATLKGWQYALEHQEEIADIIMAQYNTQNKTREHLLFEANQLKELTRPDIVEVGYMSAGRWKHVVDVYASQGKMPADFDLSGFIYDPHSKIDITWLYWALSSALAALGILSAVVWQFQRFNRRLKKEITARGATEGYLRQNELRLKFALQAANAGTYSWDVKKDEATLDIRCQELCGLPGQISGNVLQAWRERLHPEDRGRVMHKLLFALNSSHLEKNEQEFRIRNYSDEFIYVNVFFRGFHDE